MHDKCEFTGLNGFIFKELNKNWAGLAVLFSRQILNSYQDFFSLFCIIIFILLFRYGTIETHALKLCMHIFLPLGGVGRLPSGHQAVVNTLPILL